MSRSSVTPATGVAYSSGAAPPTGPSPALPYSTTGSATSPLPTSTPTSVAATSSLQFSKIATHTWPRYSTCFCNIFTNQNISNHITQITNSLIIHFYSSSSTQLSPSTNVVPRPTPPPGSINMHTTTSTHSPFPPPLFAAPMPPPAVSTASAPHPFSAESLFQSSKGKHQIYYTHFKTCNLILNNINKKHKQRTKRTCFDESLIIGF